MKIILKPLTIAIFIVGCALNSTAQKGFQFGLGVGTSLVQKRSFKPISADFSEVNIIGNKPYYFSFLLDYGFNHRLKLKSGIEIRLRSISYGNFDDNLSTVMLSIPCVFQYNILKIEKYGLNIGVNLGFSFDRFSGFNYDYRIIRSDQITQTTYDVLIKSDINRQNALAFDNYSFRYGFVIGKSINKNHGRIELNVQWLAPRRISANLDFDISKKIETNSVLISDQNFKPSYSLLQKGCNIGLNYYFGQFSWNKN